ncbi:hypothetical protein B0H34DRAFT_422684 [Crassisporium funariophilum]|nr:hypothetical protein B0H34DRAFT_422684 [Crassisporium funariophilum]
MLSGYLLGLPLHHGNETLPIPLYHYEQICPPKDRVLVNRTSVEEFRKLDPSKIWDLGEMTGKDVLAAWLERLEQPDLVNERCLEVRMPSALVFDIWLLGTSRIQSLWDTVANAPVLTGWAWSPLVYRAYEKNRDIIVPRLSGILKRAVVATGLSNTPSLTGVRDDNVPLPLLTLHLRRGDYEGHCEHLAEWSSSYTGQNSFPEFADKDGFVVPRVVEGSKPEDAKPGDPPLLSSQEEKKKYYMKHCYPDISQVVTRVREVVHDYEHAVRTGDGKKRGQDHLEERSARDVEETLSSRKSDRKSLGNETLRGIFIMTNGDREYLKEVKKALSDDAERSKQEGSGKKDDWDFEWTWENIATSRDMELGWEEKTVGQAVDMYVAQRSEVFVGNGFSSLTGNIVMLRMFAKLDPVQIRFW